MSALTQSILHLVEVTGLLVVILFQTSEPPRYESIRKLEINRTEVASGVNSCASEDRPTEAWSPSKLAPSKLTFQLSKW